MASINYPGSSEDTSLVVPVQAAGGVAYLTIIPAVVFLLSEPYKGSSFVRFNCWQSIYLFGVWLVVDFVAGTLQSLMPTASLLTMSFLQMAMLGFFVLWLTVVLKAFGGKQVMLPVLGKLAEKRANTSLWI